MNKHMPGPWRMVERSFGGAIETKQYPHHHIATVQIHKNEEETCLGNALLIASAPMLLYWLKQEHALCPKTCCDICNEIARAEGNL